ncbi:MAG: di-trans,poly-cis-decaprenylcistransferase [bacterium]
MIQSTFPQLNALHAAIIMDGNGRWATRRGLPRIEGHKEGSKAVRRTVEAAPDLGITTLTVYAFSSDNWKRPFDEVQQLMALLYDYLRNEREHCAAHGIRLSVIGRRDRLTPMMRTAIRAAETATARGTTLHFRIAIDYSARDSILRAASRWNGQTAMTRDAFLNTLADLHHPGVPLPEVDLLIRTGGEKRLSDFLLWESAYAELYFTDCMWPDFGAEDLHAAVEEFHRRTRRFGAVPLPATGS